MTAVSIATGISANTIRTWKTQDWWRELEGIIKEEEGTEQSVKLRGIVDKTLNIIADRLENGDFQYDPKTGGLIRRPVLLRDAGKVGMDVWVRKEALDVLKIQKLKQPSIEESLKRIADEFAKLAKGAHVSNDTGVPTELGSQEPGQNQIVSETPLLDESSQETLSSNQGGGEPPRDSVHDLFSDDSVAGDLSSVGAFIELRPQSREDPSQ